MNGSVAALRHLILIIFTLKFANSQNGIDYCYGSDHERPQTEFFSSKTSYLMTNHPKTDKHFFVEGKSFQFYSEKCQIVGTELTKLNPQAAIQLKFGFL